MMNRIFVFSIICILFSCSENFDKELEVVDYSVTKKTRVENDICNYILMSKLSDSRTTGFHKLVPIIQNGDTVMYIANYDEGWDLFSNDRRVPMVIASSPTGHLDMNDPSMPSTMKSYINSVADELYEIKQQTSVEKETYGEWNMVYIDNDEVDLSKITTRSRVAHELQPGEGYWQLLEMSTPIRESVSTEKLTTTEWGQSSPWNLYIPYAEDDLTQKGPAGCAAVAAGQYLYYLHYKYGNPAATITTATYNSANNTYTYSGNSSTVWNSMAKNYNETGTDVSAKFIGYVGKSIGTKYEVQSATANFDNEIAFVNELANRNYYKAIFSSAYVNNELNSGKAVLACAWTSNNEGHAFIIDQKRTHTITVTSRYGWVGTDSYGRDTNGYDMDGNIIGYTIFYEEENTSTSNYYTMNWGWNGIYNNTEFVSDMSWNADGSIYTNKKIAKE